MNATSPRVETYRVPRVRRATSWVVRRGPQSLLVALGLFGAAVILYSTRWGAWAFSDSTAYVVAARNVQAGEGMGIHAPSGRMVPFTGYPPGYPLLLTVLSPVTGDPLASARVIGVIGFGLLVAGTGFALRALGADPWIAVSAAAGGLASPTLIWLFSGAVSEPAYIVLSIAGLYALAAHLIRGRGGTLVAAALCAGGAWLMRYVGAANVLAGSAVLLLCDRAPGRRRLGKAALYGALASVPMALWLLYVRWTWPGSGPRQFVIELQGLWDRLGPFRDEVVAGVSGWIPFATGLLDQSHRLRIVVLAAPAAAAAVLIGVTWRRSSDPAERARARPALCVLTTLTGFAASYALVLGLAYAFAHPRPDIDDRMLSPLQPTLIGLALVACWCLGGFRAWRRVPHLAAGLILLALLGAWVPESVERVERLHEEGAGYTAAVWRTSSTLHAAEAIPPEVPLITNEPALLLLHLDRAAYEIAELYRTEPLPEYTRFGDDPGDEAQRVFREQAGRLVLFDTFYWQLDLIYQGETRARHDAFVRNLVPAQALDDGVVYVYPSENDQP